MRTFVFVFVLVVLWVTSAFAIICECEEVAFLRGDTNDDELLNVSDAIFLSNYLYAEGKSPRCLNQADVNDDGAINAADPIYLLNHLFRGGPRPPDANGDHCPP